MKKLTAKDMALCGLFAALTAVGAFIKISIPLEPFPMHFTLQLFFVLLAGLVLGGRRAAMSVCIYLSVGLVGVPVFAAGGGPAYVIRPTFGFLLGFVFAAFVAGTLSFKRKGGGVKWDLWAAFWGMAAYYFCGAVYFYMISNYVISMLVTWKVVIINCFLITVAEDSVLCVLAAVLARRLRRAVDWG